MFAKRGAISMNNLDRCFGLLVKWVVSPASLKDRRGVTPGYVFANFTRIVLFLLSLSYV